MLRFGLISVGLAITCFNFGAFAGEETSDASDPCKKALSASEYNAAQVAKQIENLKRVGFQNIDQSRYFSRGSILVQVRDDGSIELFTNLSAAFKDPNKKLIGLRVSRDPRDEDELHLFFDSGRDIYMDGRGRTSSRSSYESRQMAREFTSIPHEKQLLDAGFIQDPLAPSIYHLGLDQWRKGQVAGTMSVIIIIKNAEVSQVVASVSKDIARSITPDTDIVGFRIRPDEDGRGISTIRLRQGSFEFEIDDRYSDGSFTRSTQTLAQDLADVSDRQLPLNLPLIKTEPTDRWIGGFNLTAWERAQSSSFETLKQTLKPDKSSSAGFIGNNEQFEDVLIEDHKHVGDERGLTHQQLALPLLKLMAAQEQGYPTVLTYMGYRYRCEYEGWMGYQESPFNDGLRTLYDMTVTNLDTGKEIKYSGLVPHFIYRYGFYEGRGTRYRMDPDQILEVFPFIKTGRRKEGSNASVGIDGPLQPVDPSYVPVMEWNTLISSVQAQAKDQSLTIIERDATGKITKTYRTRFDEMIAHTKDHGVVKVADPNSGKEPIYLQQGKMSFPLAEPGSLFSAHKLLIESTYGTTEVFFDTSNGVKPAQFDLSSLGKNTPGSKLARFAEYLTATYGDAFGKRSINYRKDLILHFYSDQGTAETVTSKLLEVKVIDDFLIFKISLGNQVYDFKAKVEQVYLHHKYSEIILDLSRNQSSPQAQGTDDRGLKVSFAIDVGDGNFYH